MDIPTLRFICSQNCIPEHGRVDLKLIIQARKLSTEDTSSSDNFHAATVASESSMSQHLVSKYGAKTLLVFGLLELLTDSKTVLPWTFCEDPTFRRNLKCCSANGVMSAKGLKKWAALLINAMVVEIKALLRD